MKRRNVMKRAVALFLSATMLMSNVQSALATSDINVVTTAETEETVAVASEDTGGVLQTIRIPPVIRRMLRQHLQRRHRQKHQRKLRLQVVIRPETFPTQAVPQQSRPHQGIHLAVERTMEHRQSPMVLRQIRRKKRSRQAMQT